MAKTTETRIYKPAQDLLMKITNLVAQFPRNRRFLADRLFVKACELVEFIFLANVSKEKVSLIKRIKEHLVAIQVSLRLSKDLRLLTAGHFGTTVEIAQEVSKQAQGWLTWAEAQVSAAEARA